MRNFRISNPQTGTGAVEGRAFDRRSLLFGAAAGAGALSLGGCMATDGISLAEAEKMYGPVPDKKFPIPAADVSKVDHDLKLAGRIESQGWVAQARDLADA